MESLQEDLAALFIGQPLADGTETAVHTGDAPDDVAMRLIRCLRIGAFAEVLADPLAARLLDPADVACTGVAERAKAYIDSVPAASTASATLAVHAIGAAALSLFAHANWSGAPVCTEVPIAHAARRSAEALEALRMDGESAYALLDAPGLLCAARALLLGIDATAALPGSFAAPWWAARCAVLHQRCLEVHAPSLEKTATRAMRSTIDALVCIASGGGKDAATAAATGALEGHTVMVVGLEGRPELNTQRGRAGKFDEAKGRYAVRLDGGGEAILLKPDNLLSVEGGVAADGGAAEGGDAAAANGASAAEEAATACWPSLWREAAALARIELAQLLLLHKKIAPADVELAAARATLGVRFVLGGALGMRTKHQQTKTSQLVVRTEHAAHALPRTAPDAASAAAALAALPDLITEEDDQLLSQPKIDDAASGGDGSGGGGGGAVKLVAVETALLLAEVGSRRISRPLNEVTVVEEEEAYVRHCLASPCAWASATHALRLKAALESGQKRRQHQSLMQLQSLLDDVRPPSASGDAQTMLARHMGPTSAAAGEPPDISDAAAAPTPAAAEAAAAEVAAAAMDGSRLALRLRCFWAVAVAPKWALGAEVARTLAALGLLTEVTPACVPIATWRARPPSCARAHRAPASAMRVL